MRLRVPITSPPRFFAPNGGVRPSVLWAVGLGWLAMLAVSANAVGVGGRRYVTPPRRLEFSSPGRAFDAMRDSGARGRVLVLFDDRADLVERTYLYAFMDSLDGSGTRAPITRGDIVSGLIYHGVVREVWFVPPEEAWSRVVRVVKTHADARRVGAGYRIRFAGAPLIVVQEKDLPRFGERVIVYDADSPTGGESARKAGLFTGPASPDLFLRLRGVDDR